jgi:hypothetical protein
MVSNRIYYNKIKTMVCKGICERYKANRPKSGMRYKSGQKRCQICEIYIAWKGIWCPCCSYKLRSSPRSRKNKFKLRRERDENPN